MMSTGLARGGNNTGSTERQTLVGRLAGVPGVPVVWDGFECSIGANLIPEEVWANMGGERPQRVEVKGLVMPDYGEEGRYVPGDELVAAQRYWTEAGCEGEEPLPVSRVVKIMTEWAEVVRAALDKGIVNGDLKPGNLLVPRNDGEEVVVVDWVGGTEVLGTIPYMAPERFGRQNEMGGEKSEMFALAVSGLELILGEVGFLERVDGDWKFVGLAGSVRAQREGWSEERIGFLETVFIRALSVGPEDRFESVEEMLKWLELGLLGDETQDWSQLGLMKVDLERWRNDWRSGIGVHEWMRRRTVLVNPIPEIGDGASTIRLQEGREDQIA